jgi:hypothetical protein
MSFQVTITLTTYGGNTGPLFDLYTDADNYATAFATDVAKADLISGYVATVDSSATVVRCKSKGTCTNYIDMNITGIPGVTPTPTATPTATPPGVYQFKLGTGTTQSNACNNYNPSINNTYFTNVATITNGTTLYTQAYPLSNTVPNNYYSDGTNQWFCTSGVVVGLASCVLPTPTMTPTPTKPVQGFAIVSGTTYSTSTACCNAGLVTPNGNLYGVPGVTIPVVGNYLYTSSNLTGGFVGNNYYYEILKGTRYAVKIDNFGQMIDVVECVSTTPTPTPTATFVPPPFFPITLNLNGFTGMNARLTVYQSSDGSSFTSAQTLDVTGANEVSAGFNGTPGYYYYVAVARTSGTGAIKANAYTTSYSANLNIDSAACANTSTDTSSSPIQLPGTVVTSTIIFGGNLDTGCL